MLSKFVSANNKVELWSLERNWKNQLDTSQKVYHSVVHSVLTEDTLEIVMPTEQSRLLLLPIDSEYEMIVYGATGMYQCFVRVTDRYKSNNVFIMVAELTSDLRKYQRREFYRHGCALEMQSRSLEDAEAQTKHSVIVDISGGGFRFLSAEWYGPDSLVHCKCYLYEGQERKEFQIIGRVLAVKEWEKRPGFYEHRVQYHNLDVVTREQIIKYIFEEERKGRKKERLT